MSGQGERSRMLSTSCIGHQSGSCQSRILSYAARVPARHPARSELNIAVVGGDLRGARHTIRRKGCDGPGQ